MAANVELPPLPAPEDMLPNINAGDGLCIATWALFGLSTVLVG